MSSDILYYLLSVTRPHIVPLTASLVLLIPVAMERDWLTAGSSDHVVPALHRFRETLKTMGRHYWQLARSRVDRYRARRQRNKTS